MRQKYYRTWNFNERGCFWYVGGFWAGSLDHVVISAVETMRLLGMDRQAILKAGMSLLSLMEGNEGA